MSPKFDPYFENDSSVAGLVEVRAKNIEQPLRPFMARIYHVSFTKKGLFSGARSRHTVSDQIVSILIGKLGPFLAINWII